MLSLLSAALLNALNGEEPKLIEDLMLSEAFSTYSLVWDPRIWKSALPSSHNDWDNKARENEEFHIWQQKKQQRWSAPLLCLSPELEFPPGSWVGHRPADPHITQGSPSTHGDGASKTGNFILLASIWISSDSVNNGSKMGPWLLSVICLWAILQKDTSALFF